MEIQHGRKRYGTTFVQDNVGGSAGIEIVCDGSVVARVIYWDACGDFFVETIGGDIPLAVMESAVQEAMLLVKFR